MALGSAAHIETFISELCKHLAGFSAPLSAHLPDELSELQTLFKAEERHGHLSLLLQRRRLKKDKQRRDPAACVPGGGVGGHSASWPGGLSGDVPGPHSRDGAGNSAVGGGLGCPLQRTVPRGEGPLWGPTLG